MFEYYNVFNYFIILYFDCSQKCIFMCNIVLTLCLKHMLMLVRCCILFLGDTT